VGGKMGIKEKYSELQKRYKLPSFEEIDKEFEISKIEKDAFLLREVRRKIADRLKAYSEILENILQPDTTVTNLFESKIFNEEERNEIFSLYKKLMFFERFSVETSIDEDDKKSADFINAVFKDLGEIKKNFLKFIRQVKDNWLKDSDIKEELGYMG
jgi:hypothetical protein